MRKVLAWIKANPWKVAVIALSVVVVLSGAFGYGCGYIKGCSAAQEETK